MLSDLFGRNFFRRLFGCKIMCIFVLETTTLLFPFITMPLNPNKNLKLFYSIGEVAELFGVNDTLLRFWEREFPQISPKKGGRGVRQYTQEDIDIIRVIYNLVKVRGLRIEAAREVLRKNREGTVQATEVVDRLRAIKAELQTIKRELGEL